MFLETLYPQIMNRTYELEPESDLRVIMEDTLDHLEVWTLWMIFLQALPYEEPEIIHGLLV
jgi:hypothetical protein